MYNETSTDWQIGLAVMGENLVLNSLESKGFSVAVYNRNTERVDNFLASRAKGKGNHRRSALKSW